MQESVTVSYILTTEEIKAALLAVKKGGVSQKKLVVQTVIFAVLAVCFGLRIAYAPTFFPNYFLLAVSLACIPFIWIVPKKTLQRNAETATDGVERTITVYADKLEIKTLCNDTTYEYSLLKIVESESVFALETCQGRVICIPKRVFSEQDLITVREYFSGKITVDETNTEENA